MLNDLLFRLRSLLRRRGIERELDDELQFHLTHQMEKEIQTGLPPAEARRRAQIAFGGLEQTKDECRDARGTAALEAAVQDIRYALRGLRKSPAFTSVAILSLALGIGANTAIFTLMDAVMLKSLPVKAPDQLYRLAPAGQSGILEGSNFRLYEMMRDQSRSFGGVLLYNRNQWQVGLAGEVELVYGQCVTGNYYSLLGVQAAAGRTLTEEDDRTPGGNPVAVLSHSYWERRFGRDPSVLGRTITINQVPFTIVGVTPAEFFGLEMGRSMDITVPMSMHPQVGSGMDLKTGRGFTGAFIPIARLKSGVSPDQATAEANVLFEHFLAAWMPGMSVTSRRDKLQRCELIPARNGLMKLRAQFSKPLQILMGMVGLVLIIACANVANLLLVRARARQREIALRLAIGASRARVVRQLVTESILLATLGGAIGLALALWGARVLVGFLPQDTVPLTFSFTPDIRVLVFTAVISLLTGVLFGIMPALRVTQWDLNSSLKSGARLGASGATLAARSVGRAMVVCQIALSLVLLAGAVMFARSLHNLRQVDLGFQAERVFLTKIDFNGSPYKGPTISNLNHQLLEQLKSIPGVHAAGFSVVSPFDGTWEGENIFVPGFERADGRGDEIRANWVSPGYLTTMGIQLVAGRDFSPADERGNQQVAIVTENLAHHYFPGQNPIGRRVGLQRQLKTGPTEIVGVIRDFKSEGVAGDNAHMVYMPAAQETIPHSRATFALRSDRAANDLAAAVLAQFQGQRLGVPIVTMKTMRRQLDESVSRERLLATLSSFFGLLALLLASAGIYGVMAYGVTRRVNEIGIRMALGARVADVLWLVLREALALVALGVAVGLPVALIASQAANQMLFRLTAEDPATLAAAAGILGVAAVFAAYLPARRAAMVNPVTALHYE